MIIKMNIDTIEIISVAVFFIAFYGLITGKSVIRGIVSIIVMEAAIIMFVLGIGYTNAVLPPIGDITGDVADPLPQALVITAIIIGVAVTAVNLTMLIALYRKFKTTQWDELRIKNME
ncbi:MAG: cation:proton antiporter subunit C [Oscillospiraceae bacterium]|jgi:multicomponent Na+:H+ antiporter subunit C|nr:cation:proton antiporter subunit C [Oscillospiraceae bacterium]